MRWCGTEGNEVVWNGGLDLLVLPKGWDILGVARGGAPVWPCGGVLGLMERSVGRRLCVIYEDFFSSTTKKVHYVLSCAWELNGGHEEPFEKINQV